MSNHQLNILFDLIVANSAIMEYVTPRTTLESNVEVFGGIALYIWFNTSLHYAGCAFNSLDIRHQNDKFIFYFMNEFSHDANGELVIPKVPSPIDVDSPDDALSKIQELIGIKPNK